MTELVDTTQSIKKKANKSKGGPKKRAITVHEPLAQLFFLCTREYTQSVLLPRFGTSAFLLLGVNALEVLEIVPLFEDFMAELPFKMAINMRIIGVLLYQASE